LGEEVRLFKDRVFNPSISRLYRIGNLFQTIYQMLTLNLNHPLLTVQ
jgi:hypothetical protein